MVVRAANQIKMDGLESDFDSEEEDFVVRQSLNVLRRIQQKRKHEDEPADGTVTTARFVYNNTCHLS